MHVRMLKHFPKRRLICFSYYLKFKVTALYSVNHVENTTIVPVLEETALPQKLKSSFKPSRHWGPRDPITHYYWLARREEVERGNMLRTRYHRRQLGQLSGQPSFLNLTNSVPEKVNEISSTDKRRSNSDDWIYTVCRKQLTHVQERLNESRRRAKSLDWSFPNTKAVTPNDSRFFGSSIGTPDSAGSHESNNNLRIAQYIYKKNNK